MAHAKLIELAQMIQKACEAGLDARLRFVRRPRSLVVGAASRSSIAHLAFPFRDATMDTVCLPCPTNIKPAELYPLPGEDLDLCGFVERCRWWLNLMARPEAKVEVNLRWRQRLIASINLGGPCWLVIEQSRAYLEKGRSRADITGSTLDIDRLRYAIAPGGEPPQLPVGGLVGCGSGAEVIGLFTTDDHVIFRPGMPIGIDQSDPRVVAVVEREGVIPVYVATDGKGLWCVGGDPELCLITVPPEMALGKLPLHDVQMVNDALWRHDLHRFMIKRRATQ